MEMFVMLMCILVSRGLTGAQDYSEFEKMLAGEPENEAKTGAQDYSEFEKMLAGEPENEAKTVELGPPKPQGAEETKPQQSERTKSEDYSDFEKMLAEEPGKNEAKTDKLGSTNAQEAGGPKSQMGDKNKAQEAGGPKSQMGDKNEAQEAGGPKSEMGDKNEAKESGEPKSEMGDKNKAQEAQDEGIGKEPEISNDDDVDKAIREKYEEAIALDVKLARSIQEQNIIADNTKQLHKQYTSQERPFFELHNGDKDFTYVPEMIIKKHVFTMQIHQEIWSGMMNSGGHVNSTQYDKYKAAVLDEWKDLKNIITLSGDEVGKKTFEDYKTLRLLLPSINARGVQEYKTFRNGYFHPLKDGRIQEFKSLNNFLREPNQDMVVNVSKRSLAKEDNIDKRLKEATVREQAPEDESADVMDRRLTVKDTAAKGNEEAAKGNEEAAKGNEEAAKRNEEAAKGERSEDEVVARLDAAKTVAEVLGKSSGDVSSKSVTATPNAATAFEILQHHSVLQIAILSSVVVPLILAMIIVVAYRKSINHWCRKHRTAKGTELCGASNQISDGGLEPLKICEPSAKHSAEREGGNTFILAAMKPKN